MNGVLADVPRWQRRKLLSEEERRRKSGDWGDWISVGLPDGTPGCHGWAKEFRLAQKNEVFCVLSREVECGVRHLMISSLSGERPTFWEMQRIKDELAGEDKTAVEVYPPRDEVVDDANAYHIWVLPRSLSFGLT